MYRKKKSGILKHIDFLILDIIVLEISFVISYVYRNGWGFENNEFKKMYTQVAFLLILVSLIIAVSMESYKNIIKRGYYVEFLKTVKHIAAVSVILLVFLYLTKNAEFYSRTVYILTFSLGLAGSYIVRVIWKFLLRKGIIKPIASRKTMILITTSDKAEELLVNLKGKLDVSYINGGLIIVDKEMTGKEIAGVSVVANKADASVYICRNWVDEVFISLGPAYADIEKKIVDNCILMGITVHQFLAQTVSQPGKIQVVEKIGSYTILSSAINTIRLRDTIFKRIVDIIGGLVGVFFTGILFIFVAPAIYIKSPGPIFFKQWRVGRNGKKFQIYKFRSMYLDAEERKAELMKQNKVKDGMMFKMDNDPRIIGGENGKGIGNFIRKTSIDEFPQFFNVLKGDMSLVGTRPPTLDEWEKYELHHRARLAIKPGLTGMWQVSGRSTITDFEEIVKLDTEYITNWSIGKDIKILFKTVYVVLKREGSS